MKRQGAKRAAGRSGRKTSRRASGDAGGRAGGRKTARAGGKRRLNKAVLAAGAIAKAAARAESTLRAELRNKNLLADRMADDAIAEAEEIGLLLDSETEEESEAAEGGEEDEYFVKVPAQGPPRPRVRPAPGIADGTPRVPAKGAAARSAAAKGAAAKGKKADAAAKRDAKAAVLEKGARHLFPRSFRKSYPVAVRAQGVFIFDGAGNAYLDGCSGAVVCSIGHGVREVTDILSAQAQRLAFVHSSQFVTRESAELSARIAALAPGDMKTSGRVYLVSGGSEAVETAIKLARQYHLERGAPSKYKIISRRQSYHGSTIGALAATGNVARREPYLPMIASSSHIAPCFCYRCPLDKTFPSCDVACVDELERAIQEEGPDTVAAFIAEPVVGATLGAVPAVDGYWERARAICDQHNVLLIADEVMTGIGRTGKNFAIDHFKVVPDLIVTGKGLSAGYTPLGAVIARGFITDAIKSGRGYFEHGFTYSANPLSAAIGSAVLDYVAKHHLIARAAKMGRVLGERLEGLRKHAIVGDVRGMGMLWGIELVKPRAGKTPFPPAAAASRLLYDACLAEGLLIYPGSGTRDGKDGDHCIIAPPFTITDAEIDDLVARLDRGLAAVQKSLR